MMPNFLIIGAARSGTTSLHRYLGEHPEIYMSPVKEPNFFAYDGERFDLGESGLSWRKRARLSITDPGEYRALFSGVRGEKAIGEASPTYMRSPGAASRILRLIPEVRLIAVLRNPAERAYANYMGRLRDGWERNPDPRDAIGAALSGRGPRWRSEIYIRPGFYRERLRPFYECFNRRGIRVFLFDDLARDPQAVLREIFSYLGVDPGFTPDTSIIHNRSGRIDNPLLRLAWTQWNATGWWLGPRVPRRIRERGTRLVRQNLSRPPLPPDLRAALIEHYRPDILELESLIERDLSAWLV